VIILKSNQEIARIRTSCKIVSEVLNILKDEVKPGVTTAQLDAIAEAEAVKRKSKPAFKGYNGYKYSLCTSVNSEVVHGVPSNRHLCAGDIVSLDFGVIVDGFYGDAAITLPVGNVSSEALRLLQVTEESLSAGISACSTVNKLSDISHAVQSYVESRGYSVVRDYVGHGIGRSLHESPQIPNYGAPGKGPRLKPGMVLAIEPMINQGGYAVKLLGDGWTAVTEDGSLSAHFEHTIAVTDNGPEILTKI
jgi:methionyl aminopeptidase